MALWSNMTCIRPGGWWFESWRHLFLLDQVRERQSSYGIQNQLSAVEETPWLFLPLSLVCSGTVGHTQ